MYVNVDVHAETVFESIAHVQCTCMYMWHDLIVSLWHYCAPFASFHCQSFEGDDSLAGAEDIYPLGFKHLTNGYPDFHYQVHR